MKKIYTLILAIFMLASMTQVANANIFLNDDRSLRFDTKPNIDIVRSVNR